MEMQGRDKAYFNDAGDGAWANFSHELQQIRNSQKRHCRIVGVVILVLTIVLLALIIVAGTQAHRIRQLRNRQGLLLNTNVTFASYAGDRKLDGLTYGGSLFRGSGFWTPRESLPAPLTDHAAVAVGELIYIIGGADANSSVVDQLWLFDTTFHNYTRKASIPEPRYRFGAAVLDGKIYVLGGRKDSNDSDDSLSTRVCIYDIASNTWSDGPALLEPQSDPCAAAINGKVYLIGGYDPVYKFLAKMQVYDPITDKWSYGPDLPTPRGDLMCVAFDDEIFVLGGYYDNETQPFSSRVESFNPVAQKWTTRPELLTPRGDGAVAVLPGRKLLVIGGEGYYENADELSYGKHTTEVFFGADGTWVEKALIPTARFRTAAATVGRSSYVFGGSDWCTSKLRCPALDSTAMFLDVDHPHVYIYLKNDAYDDNAALTTYPV